MVMCTVHSPRCGECRWPGLDARQGGGRGSIELGFIIIFFIVIIIVIITHQECYEVVELLMDYHLLSKYTIRSIVCEASCHAVSLSFGHLMIQSLGHLVTRSHGRMVTSHYSSIFNVATD